MVDGAGAIYVIGGWRSGGNKYSDVHVSTDGGARPDYVGGGWVGGCMGVLWGTTRVPHGELRGYYRGSRKDLRECRGTKGLV